MSTQTRFTGFRAEHVNTYHAPDPQTIPRANLAGELGWCQLCGTSDTPGVTYATWRNPITGETVEVTVCEGHKGHPHIVPGSCRDVR